MLLNELTGTKQFKDLGISDLIEYFIKHSGYKMIGEGFSGTVFKHPTKPEIVKFWLIDSAYDAFIKYALAHQDNPYIVKVLQKPKTLTMFHSRPTKAYIEPLDDETDYDDNVIEFPKKLTYTRLELLKPLTKDSIVYGIKFGLLFEFLHNVYSAEATSSTFKTFEPSKIGQIIDLLYDETYGTTRPKNTDIESIVQFFETVKGLFMAVDNQFSYDLHIGNVMLRGNIPVIIDPFADTKSMDVTNTFNFYSQRDNIKAAIAMVNGREK